MNAKNARRGFSEDDREKMVQRMILDRIRHKLEDIKEYYEELEHKFESDKRKLSERYEKEVTGKKLTTEMEDQIGEYFGEEHQRIEGLFLKNFRYSVVVTIYSFLETTLNDLCYHLCRSKKLLLALDEIKGDGIERARLYLQKVCLINFPDNSHEWQEIQKFNLIRNCIVHTEGNVEEIKSPDKLKRVIRSTKGVCLDPQIQRFVHIEKAYIPSIICCIENFINNVHDEAFKSIKVAKLMGLLV